VYMIRCSVMPAQVGRRGHCKSLYRGMAAVWDEWISDGVDELQGALVRIFTESANPETHDCAKDAPILHRSFTVPSPQWEVDGV
jgi:hypothetical protein